MTSRPVLATVAAPAAGTYRIDPARSRITFSTRHLLGLGGVRGTFDLLDGEIAVPDGPGSPLPGRRSTPPASPPGTPTVTRPCALPGCSTSRHNPSSRSSPTG